MKLTIYIRFYTFILLLVAALFSTDAHATVYRTDSFGFGSSDWDDEFTWENFSVPPNPLPPGDEIIITSDISVDLYSSKEIQGTLTIESSGSLYVDGSTLTNSGTISGGGRLFVLSSSTLTNSGTIDVTNLDLWANSTFNNTGTYTLPAIGILFIRGDYLPEGTFNWTSGGEIRVLFGGNIAIDNPLTIPSNSALICFGNGGSLITINSTVTVPSTGSLDLYNNGPLTISGTLELEGILGIYGGTVSNSGTIKGTGTIVSPFSNATIAGTVAPGNSVGTMEATGDITFSGTVEIEADNPTTYDVIESTDGGTVDISSATIDFQLSGSVNDYSNGNKFQVFTGFAANSDNPTVTNNFSANGLVIDYNGNGEFEVTAEGALPVELIDFTARVTDKRANLKWSTASETNNRGFYIERSYNGRDWKIIDFIDGAGTTFESQTYNYTDATPYTGINYYRLKQTDFDGAYEYSKTVSVEVDSGDRQLFFFPNPSEEGNTVNLQIRDDKFEAGTLTLFDVTAKAVFLWDIAFERMELDVSQLPKGMYIARLTSGSEQLVERLLIE